jgi:erythromycin esterase-like protein
MTDHDAGRGSATAIQHVRAAALALDGAADLDPLLDIAGGARLVLIGEASHGTHEYQHLRAQLTQRLIAEHGFGLVAVEADQADCNSIDRCVRHLGAEVDPGSVLEQHRHWPSWMWANAETVAFCRWLRQHNRALPVEQRVGWHGLDSYPLWAATRRLLDYLRERIPDRVNTALDAPLHGQPILPEAIIDSVARHLAAALPDSAQATAAEAYYRATLHGGALAMNARAAHWLDTLDRLLTERGTGSRAVVWAHNTHVGDARGTDIPASGIVSIGQLARERYGANDVILIGFAGGAGTVIAAPQRGGSMDTIPVPPARDGSLEAVLTDATVGERALFVFPERRDAGWLAAERGHRAIGAVYHPSLEPLLYVPTRLGQRYDAMCWVAHITPIQALHLDAARRGELETLRAPDQSHGA